MKVVMRATEEVCGTTKGGKHLERENEEVQESMRRKKGCIQEMADAGWTRTEGGV